MAWAAPPAWSNGDRSWSPTRGTPDATSPASPRCPARLLPPSSTCAPTPPSALTPSLTAIPAHDHTSTHRTSKRSPATCPVRLGPRSAYSFMCSSVGRTRRRGVDKGENSGMGISVGDRGTQVRRRLPSHPSSAGEARRMVRRLLTDAGRRDLLEPASLLVSEVVTNALVHSGTSIDVSMALREDGVLVE